MRGMTGKGETQHSVQDALRTSHAAGNVTPSSGLGKEHLGLSTWASPAYIGGTEDVWLQVATGPH